MKSSKRIILGIVCILVIVCALFTGCTPKEQPVTAEQSICTIKIDCSDILNNMSDLKQETSEIIPSDGIILESTNVTFSDGETVFDVLNRIVKEKKIHLESSKLPNVFVKGLGNIYNGDCGDMSGWLYFVNEESPSYACSEYKLKDGDKVEFKFICDISKLYN